VLSCILLEVVAMRVPKLVRESSGQALIETVLLLPLLLAIVLNAINFGYFFLMALNITSSARTSGLYSIMGSATPAAIALPKAGPTATTTTVSYLAYQDLTGAVYSPSTNAGVQVCSPSVGVLNAGTVNQKSQCSAFGSVGSFPAADVDPELNSGSTAPAFLLNRVDVAYQFTPPIPLMPFNILVLASPACTTTGGSVSCTFYRHTQMRAMN
jgi:Flp pilus assembly protein TadG